MRLRPHVYNSLCLPYGVIRFFLWRSGASSTVPMPECPRGPYTRDPEVDSVAKNLCQGVIWHGLSSALGRLNTVCVSRTTYGLAQLGATEPEALVKAFILLTRISNREIESCTISGGIDCAWLGAVANFALGLSVSVTQADGVVAYKSSTGRRLWKDDCQVTIPQSGAGNSKMEVVQKSFYVPSGRSLFREHTDYTESRVFKFATRSQWDSIIGDSFGTVAEDLLQGSSGMDFAKLLSYVARRQTPADIGDIFANAYDKYQWPDLQYDLHGSSGDDILNFAYERFPELRPGLDSIRFRTFGEISEIEASGLVKSFQVNCRCPTCRKAHQTYQNMRDDNKFTCLVGVAGTIVRYIGLLSIAKVSDLLPTPSGLRMLYEHLKLQEVLDICGSRWKDKWRKKQNLLYAILLFSAPGCQEELYRSTESLALAGEGICCFFGFLTNVKSHPSNITTVYIMPGHIEYAGALYVRIKDFKFGDDRRDFVFPVRKALGFALFETESSTELEIACTTKSTDEFPAVSFQAGKIISWASYWRLPPTMGCNR